MEKTDWKRENGGGGGGAGRGRSDGDGNGSEGGVSGVCGCSVPVVTVVEYLYNT